MFVQTRRTGITATNGNWTHVGTATATTGTTDETATMVALLVETEKADEVVAVEAAEEDAEVEADVAVAPVDDGNLIASLEMTKRESSPYIFLFSLTYLLEKLFLKLNCLLICKSFKQSKDRLNIF